MKITEETKVTINLVLLVTLLLGLISGAFIVGRNLEGYDQRLTALEDSNIHRSVLTAKVDKNTERLAGQDIKLAEIQTDLKWIRAKLEDY